MISELPCLSNILEFLTLSETMRVSTVNRWWSFVATVCPLTVLDTVGLGIPMDRLLSMISRNRTNLTTLRISVCERDLEQFIIKFLAIDLESITSLSVFAASDRDGSVRVSLKDMTTMDKYSGSFSLVLGCDPSIACVRKLVEKMGPSLSTIAFLRGCWNLYKSEDEILQFFEESISLENLKCIHFGACNSNVDMDPVIARILIGSPNLEYIQWTGAGASIDMMKSLTGRKNLECAFEGIGFLSLFSSF